MIETFLLFTSTKIGKIVASIVAVLFVILMIAIYSNSSSIQEKFFGIDSKATLQAKLQTANTNLDQTIIVNKELNDTIIKSDAINKIKIDGVSKLEEDIKVVNYKKETIINNRKTSIANLKVNKEIPPSNQDKEIAKININSIWLAYCENEYSSTCGDK